MSRTGGIDQRVKQFLRRFLGARWDLFHAREAHRRDQDRAAEQMGYRYLLCGCGHSANHHNRRCETYGCTCLKSQLDLFTAKSGQPPN